MKDKKYKIFCLFSLIYIAFVPIYANFCHTILHPNQLAALPPEFVQKIFYSEGEELIEVLTGFLKNYNFLLSPSQYIQVEHILHDLIQKEKLSHLKISGCSFVFDALNTPINHSQKYIFWVTYRDNDTGDFKKRLFEGCFESSGIKLEFGFRMNLIVFVGTEHNFLNTNKKLLLGRGIDVSLALPFGGSLVYAPFLNTSGGILILGLIAGACFGLSVLTGGYLQWIGRDEA